MSNERIFHVWDPLNEERSDAERIDAWSPIEAAEQFANNDHDHDGVYGGDGQSIAVEDAIGDVSVYMVAWVDHPPAWRERLSEHSALRAVRMLEGDELAETLATIDQTFGVAGT